jgi:AcrR family transcriptional regulator
MAASMRTKSAETRNRIVEAAYESFWRSGFIRTSVDGIAERAKVTKRTVYAYFRSKDDLLAAVLERYHELAGERLKRIGDRMPADRDGLIDSYFGQLVGWASTTPRWSGSGFTRLVVELADLPGHPARAIAKRAKAETEAWLAQKLADARVTRPEQHAREIVLLTEGAMSLTLIHGGRSYIDAAAQAAKQLVRRS